MSRDQLRCGRQTGSKVQKDADCVVLCAQFWSDGLMKPVVLTAATACQEVLLRFPYQWMSGRSACYRSRVSRGEEDLWLADWHRERRPNRREDGSRFPGPANAAVTLEAVADCVASYRPGLSST